MLKARGSVVLAFVSLCAVGLSYPSENWPAPSVWQDGSGSSTPCVNSTEVLPVTTTEVNAVTTSIYGLESQPTTIYQTIITTEYVTVTETLILTASEELVPYTRTERITSVTLCPTRLVNPTFTAPGPYPTDWTWGCPPNWLCRPGRIGCNFEVGLPDRGFYCSPNECIPAEALPQPLLTWDDTIYGNSTPLTNSSLSINAIDSYFNMDPPDFGLTYEIFVIEEVVTSYSTTTIQPTLTVEPRQAQTSVPGACYPWCNNCLLEAQSVGKTPAICEPGSAFEVSLSQCEQCIAVHKTDDSADFVQIAPQFQQFLDYCAGLSTAATITSTSMITSTPVALTVVTATAEAPTLTSTSSTKETASPITTLYATAITVFSTGYGQTTLSGTELSSITIVIPVTASNVTATTISGTQLYNATIILPRNYTTTSYVTTITTSGVAEVAASSTSSHSSSPTSAIGSSNGTAQPSNFPGSASNSLRSLTASTWFAAMFCIAMGVL